MQEPKMTSIWTRLQAWDSNRRRTQSDRLLALDDPRGIDRFIRWNDHGLFRELWTNFAEVSPGVYRSNHPPTARFDKIKDLGIRTILNLRGPGRNVTYLWEEKLCQDNGITFHSVALDARKAPDPEALTKVMDLLTQAERPVLFHCKSGADRAGLIAALHLLDQGRPETEARAMLSPRFLHFKRSRTGVLDLFLDRYIAAQRATGIALKDWLADEYDPTRLQADFDASR